jgi:hypothetical protein
MVARTLVEKDIEAGRRLLEELDKEKTDIGAALWYYLDDDDRWRLLLASRVVDTQGPLAAYKLVQNALAKLSKDQKLELADMSMVSPSDDRIQAIHSAIKTGPGISEVRFSRKVANNIYIEDALVYRSS